MKKTPVSPIAQVALCLLQLRRPNMSLSFTDEKNSTISCWAMIEMARYMANAGLFDARQEQLWHPVLRVFRN